MEQQELGLSTYLKEQKNGEDTQNGGFQDTEH
jgi:hypothetical protein